SLPEAEPFQIVENADTLFAGYDILGEGFVLKPGEHVRLLEADTDNSDVVLPVMNGQELNNFPTQQAARWVVCFWDLDQADARSYEAAFQVVQERVKPFRDGQKRAANREYWWQYNE